MLYFLDFYLSSLLRFLCKGINNCIPFTIFLRLLKSCLLCSQVVDLQDLDCPFWASGTCSMRIVILAIIVTVFVTFLTILAIIYFDLRKQVSLTLKKTLYNMSQQNPNNNTGRGIVVEYLDMDEEFVLNEILPGMRHYLNNEIHVNAISSSDQNTKQTFISPVKEMYTTLVIFSPNYLASQYRYVNIKKIRGEMLKAKNTIYVFVDTGIEDFTFAFLKGQRDLRTTVLWSGKDCWNTFLSITASSDKEHLGRLIKKINTGKIELTTSKSGLWPPESRDIYALDASHMQV